MKQLLTFILLISICVYLQAEEAKDVQKNYDQNIFIKIKINGKFGIKKSKDEWLFRPQFDEIIENDYFGTLLYDGGLFLVVDDGKKGIVNTKGKWVIKEYDEILYGQENLIVDMNGWIKAKLNGKWGAINTDGKWIFKPQFDDVASFTVRGQLTVKHSGKWGFIDTKGKWIVEPQYDDVYDFSENDATGFGRIIRNGKEGYVSDSDGLLLEPMLDRDKYSPDLESMFIFQKTGLLKLGNRHSKVGVIDKKGKWVLKQKFDDVEILDDRIHVTFGDLEGYTTLDGEYLTFTKGKLHLEELKKTSNSGNSKALRRYPFVCYREKSKNDTGSIIYLECIRSDVKCSNIERLHFGEYFNDLKAHEAFKRCIGGVPRLTDNKQETHAKESPVQEEFKQYAENLDKTKKESVERLKEKYTQIVSDQSSESRSPLFKDLRYYHNQMIIHYAESIEKELNGITYNLSYKELTKRRAGFYYLGIDIQQDEGYYFVIANSGWYLNEFGIFLPDEWKEFLKQCEYEEKHRYIDDAAVMISWGQLRKRVVFWENFLDNYPNFVEKSTAEEYLSLYMSTYLKGSGNSPIYAYDTKKVFPKIIKSYENFIKFNKESRFHEIVRSQYKIIKNSAFTVDKKTSKKLDINYKCAKKELARDTLNNDYFDASFKCCKASTSIEKYICSDKELAKSDKDLGILYRYIKTYSPKKQKKAFINKQRAWAKGRKMACAIPEKFIKDDKVVQCLKEEYQKRIEELESIDNMSLELGPWYYTQRDSKDPFTGHYSKLYEVHSATTFEDSMIVESFLSIIKIKDPEMKNMYRVDGYFVGANFHQCNIEDEEAYIIMKLKEGKLVYVQKTFNDKMCELSIGIEGDKIIISDNHDICSNALFPCGANIGLNGFNFKLKTSDEFAYKVEKARMYSLKKGDKYGFINEKGEWTIEPKYDEAWEFEMNGLAQVKLNGKKGVVNMKGEFNPK